MVLRSVSTGGFLVALLLAASPAAADDAASNEDASGEANSPALAEGLFARGRQLMQEGQYKQACEALSASYRLDPAGGTLLNLAVCHERAGQLATAYAEFQEALRMARRDARDDRVSIASEQLEALRARFSTLEIRVEASVQPESIQVLLDGVQVPAVGWNIRVPIDGGAHHVQARAQGEQEFSQRVTVRTERDHVVVKVPPLSNYSPALGTDSAGSGPLPTPPPRPCMRDFRWDGHGCIRAPTKLELQGRFWVWMGLTGVFTLGGVLLGVQALEQNSAAVDEARSGFPRTSEDSQDAALAYAWASTGSFVLAGTLALIGLSTSWERIPITKSTEARLRLTGSQVGAELRF